MTDRIEELRRLAAEATPGPWVGGYWTGHCRINHNGRPWTEGGHPGGTACKYDPELVIEAESHDIVSSTVPHRKVAGNYDYEEGGIVEPADHALIVAMHSALPALLDIAEAARRLSDKRTLDSDGFWVSKREMRYLDDALDALEGK